MSASTPQLPGKLGDPNLTLATDPRLDPRLVEGAAYADAAVAEATMGPDSSYEEILENIGRMEAELAPAFAEMVRGLAPVRGVTHRSEVIKGVEGNEIRLYIHEPEERKGPLPCILHFHGGGMVMDAAEDPLFMRWRDELAASGLSVVGVEFRNGAGKLGNHPFPAGLNDCASGTQWAYQNRDALGISHIVLSGESGGGNLCIATALKAKQEGWIDQIAGVYACCPYISGTYHPAPPELTSLYENGGYQLEPMTTQASVKAYDPTGENAHNPLAWPYHASVEELAGLPPHTISVNELDPLRDEGLIYARKLMAAGVPTVSRMVNGTYHGADIAELATIPEVCQSTVRDIRGFAASLRGQSARDRIPDGRDIPDERAEGDWT